MSFYYHLIPPTYYEEQLQYQVSQQQEILQTRGAQTPGDCSPWELNFVWRRLMFSKELL